MPRPRARSPLRSTTAGAVVAAAALAVSCQPADDPATLLASALERTGGADLLERTGGVVIESRGTQDRAAERQGTAPGAHDPGSYIEKLAWEPGPEGGRVAFEYRHERSDGTSEWIRELYERPGEKRLLGLEDRFEVTLAGGPVVGERDRLLRRLPSELLVELMASPDALRFVEGYSPVEIAGQLRDGTPVTLALDEDGLPSRVVYEAEIPTFGETSVGWQLDDYREVEGLGALPHRYRVVIDGRTWIDQRVVRVGSGVATHEFFVRPPDIEPGPRVETDPGSDASAEAFVEPLADGVWRVRNLRTGFHPLVVELTRGVLVTDAPAGYPLLAWLPASDVAPGPSSDWLSGRLVALIDEALAGQVVTEVAITHFHGDHAGGLEAFVEAGARVWAPTGDAPAIERWLRAEGHDPDVIGVSDAREVDGGRVVLYELGSNPHTDQMLVIWLPASRLLFVSDLFHPVSPDRFPLPSRARLDRAFLDWLARSGLEPERIYTMHSVAPGTAAHLQGGAD